MTAILGPLALRAMVNKQDGSYSSPYVRATWNKSGLLEARCRIGLDHTPPIWECSCGIWAAIDPEVCYQYVYTSDTGAALFLVEACGQVILYTHGWRAAQAVVQAAVLLPSEHSFNSLRNLSVEYGASYFNVPVISLAVALETIHEQNRRAPWESL